jgi:hypothetical protein
MATATPATGERFRLGEGPLWDAPRNRLLWVDIEGGVVLGGVLDGDSIAVTDKTGFGGMVGAVTVGGRDAAGGRPGAPRRPVSRRPAGGRAAGRAGGSGQAAQ